MQLTAKNLERYGLRRSAYDGANKRRFCLFESLQDGNERRREYDSKAERDHIAAQFLAEKSGKLVTY